MSGIKYYILDTETTGLSDFFHEIIEISIIRYDDKLQINRQIKPRFPQNASYDALKITGKSFNDLKNGVSHLQAIEDIERYFSLDNLAPKNRCIIAHNAPFDKKFIFKMWDKENKKFPADLWIDTMPIMRSILKQKGISTRKINLHASCDLLGIKKIAFAHNAKDDTKNLYFLWKGIVDSNFNYLEYVKSYPHKSSEKESNEEEEDYGE